MSKYAYILLISIVTLGSCKVKWDFEVEDFEPKIVVDGWIESGNVAYVCLSQTRPLNSVVDSLAFSEIPIRWAKVTVSDGQTTEALTRRIHAHSRIFGANGHCRYYDTSSRSFI